MERLLLFPPFADPTQPYVSLPTLKGHLRSRGLDARVVDLNVEAVHHLLLPESIDDLARRLGLRFLRLNHANQLDFEEAREYRALVDARAKVEWVLAADPSPVEVFRTRDLFYDAARYSLARRHVEAFFDALSAVCFPFRFGLDGAGHDVLPWSLELLEGYWQGRHSPLDAFYRRTFAPPRDWEEMEAGTPSCPPDDVDFVGISVVFPSQIPEAYYLCRLLRDLAPGAFLALGGPAVHQMVLRVEEPVLRRLLELVDGIGIGEGEETLSELFGRLDAWRRASALGGARPPEAEPGADTEADARTRAEILAGIPNLLVRAAAAPGEAPGDRLLGEPRLREVAAPPLDLREAAPPDYTDLDLDRYLAPSRILLYAPTRGCYWNRCSFCHYGLSEAGTAPYREVPPDRAAAHLAQLARRHGVKNFYIACDVLSPSYAVRFAEAIISRGLKIRWSSDLKIEKHFTPERCRILHRSGLRAAAFGMESGSDRLLDVIRKGCDRATLTYVNRTFHDAGVATQWMTFTDHPGETTEESIETVRWIVAEKDSVDLFIVGEFGLEHGSDVAQNPGRYGIERIFHAAGDDLRLHPLWEAVGGKRSSEDRKTVEDAVRRAAASYALRPYPWAGAVSTHHSFLHFLEFGQRAFRVHFQRAGAENEAPLGIPPPSHIAGLRERERFSVEKIEQREREFLEGYLAEALLPLEGAGGKAIAAPLCASHFRRAAAALKPFPPGKTGPGKWRTS